MRRSLYCRARVVVGADGLRSVVSRRRDSRTRGAGPARGVRHALSRRRRHGHDRRNARRAGRICRSGGCRRRPHHRRAGRPRSGGTGRGRRSRGIPGRVDRPPSATGPAVPRRQPHLAGARDRTVCAARAPPWVPGVALVGDAADFFDPFTGEGVYTALRGGELLTPYLCEAVRGTSSRAADTALAAYERCWRHEFRGKQIVERAVGAAVAMPAVIGPRGARARPPSATWRIC